MIPQIDTTAPIPRMKHKMSVGALIFALDTGRFLLGKRSEKVEDPNLWATFGGGVDHGESMYGALKRELKEEAGYHGSLEATPLYVYHDLETRFRYFNHLGVVPNEFRPKLNFETADFKWFTWPNVPTPLHPGVVRLFRDHSSKIVIKSVISGLPLKGTLGRYP